MAGDPLLPTMVGQPRGAAHGIASFRPAHLPDLGLNNLAKGVAHFGGALGAIVERREDLDINRALVDANNERTEYLHNDVLKRQGVNAESGADDFTRRSEDIGARYAAALGSERARNKFRIMYDRPFGGMYAQAFSHGVKELRAEEAAVRKAAMDQYGAELINNPDSDAAFDTLFTVQDQEADAEGWSFERRARVRAATIDGVQMARFKNFLKRGDTAGARNFLANQSAGEAAFAMSEPAFRAAQQMFERTERGEANASYVDTARGQYQALLSKAGDPKKAPSARAFADGLFKQLDEEVARGHLEREDAGARKRELLPTLEGLRRNEIAAFKQRVYDEAKGASVDESGTPRRYNEAVKVLNERMSSSSVEARNAAMQNLNTLYGLDGKVLKGAAKGTFLDGISRMIDEEQVRNWEDARETCVKSRIKPTEEMRKAVETMLAAERKLVSEDRLKRIAKSLGLKEGDVGVVPSGFAAYLKMSVANNRAKFITDDDIRAMMRQYAQSQGYEPSSWQRRLYWGLFTDDGKTHAAISGIDREKGFLNTRQLTRLVRGTAQAGGMLRADGSVRLELPDSNGRITTRYVTPVVAPNGSLIFSDTDAEYIAEAMGLHRVVSGKEVRFYFTEQR